MLADPPTNDAETPQPEPTPSSSKPSGPPLTQAEIDALLEAERQKLDSQDKAPSE